MVDFIVPGALVWAQSSVFVHLEEVYIGWVDEKPWVFRRERLDSKHNWGRNGVIVLRAIYFFLRGADKVVMGF